MNTLAPAERSAKIIHLRELIAQHAPPASRRTRPCFSSGLPAFDEALGGGLIKGALIELLASKRSCGSAALLRGVLHHLAGQNQWSALIDGADTFDPQTAGAQTLSRLLWLRCRSAAEAIQSADLLLRDGNLPFLCLDLSSNPPAQVRKIASTTWYRLQRMVETAAATLLTISPFPLIPCAEVRLELQSLFSLAALDEPGTHLLRKMKLEVRRTRLAADMELNRQTA